MRVEKLSPEPDVLSWGAALVEDEAREVEFALEDAAEDDFTLDFVLCALEEEALDLKDPVLVVAGALELAFEIGCDVLAASGSRIRGQAGKDRVRTLRLPREREPPLLQQAPCEHAHLQLAHIPGPEKERQKK